MTALIIVLASIAGYVFVGLSYARSQVQACYRRAKAEWTYDQIVKGSVNAQLAVRCLLWPVMMVVDTFRGPIRDWLWQPHTEQVERAEQLKRDAEMWREKSWDRSVSAEERDMARQLAEMCQASANEVLGRHR